MCGIVGIFSFNKLNDKAEELRRQSSLFLFTELLQTTSSRGEDATGVTTLFDNGDYMLQKMGIASPDFISRFGNKASDFEGYLNLCRKNPNNIKALIGHCRKSSVGNTTDNENNHPIKAGEIVGIHNGTLKNHNKIFKKLDCDRDGVVDSEAIFRLIQHYTDNCKEPFTLDILEETVCRLEGSFSCITYNANNPYQIGLFRDDRPMELAIVRSLNLVIIASEKKFFDKAFYDYNKHARLYNNGAKVIKTSDVSFGTLPNYNVGIMDLTAKIDKDTQLTDLIVKKNTFKTTGKWRVSVTSYNNANNFNRNSNTKKSDSVSDTKKDTTTKNKAKDEAKKETVKVEDTIEAKIFCKETKKYVNPADIVEASEIGSIKVPFDTGKIEKLEEIEDAAFANAEEEIKETVFIDGNDLEILDMDDVEEVAKEPVKKEVNVFIHPEIIEASKDSEEALLKYTDDKDLAEDIEASDEKSVAALPAFALANRLRKHMYKNAFIDGANFYKGTFLKEDTTKENAAQKIIRVAKKVIRVLSLYTEISTSERVTDSIKFENMKWSLSEDGTKELTTDSINALLSKGDFEDFTALELIKDALEERENGKKNTVSAI